MAIFGNAGGGKSALAKRLAEMTRLPLHTIDKIQFSSDDNKVPQKIPHERFLREHADLLRRDKWIIDGFGSVASAWERFAQADTLIYIDLPLITHHWWVTKRLIAGLFVAVYDRAVRRNAVPKSCNRKVVTRSYTPERFRQSWPPRLDMEAGAGASRNLCMMRGKTLSAAASHSFNRTLDTP